MDGMISCAVLLRARLRIASALTSAQAQPLKILFVHCVAAISASIRATRSMCFLLLSRSLPVGVRRVRRYQPGHAAARQQTTQAPRNNTLPVESVPPQRVVSVATSWAAHSLHSDIVEPGLPPRPVTRSSPIRSGSCPSAVASGVLV